MLVVAFLLVASILTFQPAHSKSPIGPAVQKELNKINQSKVERVIFDIAQIQSEASSSSGVGLSKFLPANSIVTEIYLHIETRFVDTGSQTFALACEDSTNLMAAADITEFVDGTIVTVNFGNPIATATGQSLSSSTAQAIAGGCEINGVYSGAASAGKLTAVIKYFIF